MPTPESLQISSDILALLTFNRRQHIQRVWTVSVNNFLILILAG